MYIFNEILRLLKENKAHDKLLIGGGIIPEDEAMELEKIGVAKLFLSGTPTDEISQYIEKGIAKRQDRSAGSI
jgi:methylmalonyl-CoA mutase C-terminal domain/subunit